ncbi:MAG TPA: branched-chain amino acid ABC transporter permease [Ktedonobacterales bacterium]|nr:branched-chain amino acid ABC transporter permease [Ktedonobacterales bacterium]
MAFFIQLVFNGIALGCIYALIALGFTIIFKASEVINFAQGEFLLVGAYVASAGVFDWNLGFVPSILLAIAVTVIIGMLFERFALRRMIGRPVFSIIMITIGLDTILRTGVVIKWGSTIRAPASPFQFSSGFNVGGVHFGANEIWTIIVTIAICALLFVFFRFTRYGLAMRATAIDQEAALAIGVNVRTVYALAWGIAGAIATIGGIFLAIQAAAFDSTLGQTALLAFPAIILGGLDSVVGAVVGGILIGLTQDLTAGYEGHFTNIVGAGFHDIAPYILMIIILFIRPYGLFGTRKVERV